MVVLGGGAPPSSSAGALPYPTFFFFFTLVAGPRRSLSLKLSDTRVYEPQIRARLVTIAHYPTWRLQARRRLPYPTPPHPGVELRANPKSISHRCHLFEVALVWELTKATIHSPLGCLQGGVPTMSNCTLPQSPTRCEATMRRLGCWRLGILYQMRFNLKQSGNEVHHAA